MSDVLKPLVAKLGRGDTLDDIEIATAFAALMEGVAPDEDIKAFLLATIPFMTDPRFITGAARAQRAKLIGVSAPAGAIDVCGTGGDGAHTLNISTAAAFVLAGAGVPVAKHGNRAMSSKTGTADVLEALGVKLTADIATLERALQEANIAFLFAQNHNPAMRHVAAARRELGQRTVFNLLGPLSNPAGVKRQLIGVFGAPYVRPMAEALRALGGEQAWVVHGAGGLDELSWGGAGANQIARLADGAIDTLEITFSGETALADELRGGDAAFNAAALRALLSGASRNEAYRIAVELNAGAGFVVAGLATRLQDGLVLAHHYLGSGAGLKALDALIDITNSAPAS